MNTEKDRIKELEAELERIKSVSKRPKDFSVREDFFKRHPILIFEGPSVIKPFSMGVGKLKAIQASWTQVEEFLDKNKSKQSGLSLNDDSI